ncbi:MAG: RNA polymerase sigma factor [Acidobacteriaceae bacterium]|nr:RNA polymerase sigma factor [Acidobacteriaceae bacterium]
MESVETLALLTAARKPHHLEDASARRLMLELYDQEHIAIRRYLVCLGLTSDVAQEIVQDAFLKLHEHLLAGGDRRNLRAWLYRVAHNLTRNAQTAARVTKTDALSADGITVNLKAAVLTAEEELLEAERNRRVEHAINGLSGPQKECLLLRAQGLKYREIAEALNISVSTVGENVQRGLEKLKELLP